MSELTPEIAADVVAACQAGAKESAEAFGRAFDGEFTVEVGEAGSYSTDATPTGFDNAGLAILLTFGDVGMAALLPMADGLLPEWVATPDENQEAKLKTLAQELSLLLTPETLLPDKFEAAHIANLSNSLIQAKVDDDAALTPLKLVAGEKETQLSVVWPLATPGELFSQNEEAKKASDTATASKTTAGQQPTGPIDFSGLPSYSRSLLKIKVPVRVVLASRKENLQDVVELATGSIIKFDKACDELLELHVGDQAVAEGEAVKIGDKFGIRLMSMLMPEEHFLKVERPQAS